MSAITRMRRAGSEAPAHPLQSAIIVIGLAIAIGLAIVVFRDAIFPARFDFDAQGIRDLIEYPFFVDEEAYGSFANIAAVYQAIGIGSDRLLAGFLGFAVLLIGIGLAIARGGGLPDSVPVSAVLGGGVIVGTAFLGTHTKELLVATLIAILLVLPRHWIGDLITVALALGVGIGFRQYWILVAGAFLVYRAWFSLRRGTRGVLILAAILVVGLGFAVWLFMGDPPDFYRTSVNAHRIGNADAETLIGRFVEWPEPLGGIINNVLTFIFLIVPLPMLALGTPYHATLALVIAALWGTLLWAMWAFRDRPMPAVTARAIAVVLAFVTVQGIYEPDYGSALRHVTPFLPLILLVLIAATEDRRKSAGGGESAGASSSPRDTGPPAPARPPQPPAPDTEPRQTESRQDRIMTQQRPATTAPGGNDTVGRIISALSSYAWVLVATAVVGAIAGWAVSQFLPKQYTSTAQVFVTASADSDSSSMYQQSMFFEQRLASYAKLVTGDAVLEPVIDELGLGETPEELANRVSAAPTPDTVLLTISATDPDPRQAAMLADATAESLIDVVGELDYTESTTEVPGGYDDNGTWTGATTEETKTPVSTMTMVSEPDIPTSPSSPDPVRNTVLGAIAGLVLAALGIAISVLRDTTIKRRADLQAATIAPVLATIPQSRTLDDGHLPDYHTEGSSIAESVRGLRTNLRFIDVDNPPNVLAVTSSKQGEGKTTVSLNLASALAAEGHSVCVVDGDLRRPHVAAALGAGIEPAVGLSTVLSGGCELDDAIQHYAARGLDVVASGPIPPNPAELIASRACRAFLRQLGERYDYVIVDAPPLLPVTDGALLASATDGAIVIAHYGKVSRDEFDNAIAALEGTNAKVIGTVLNRTISDAPHSSRYGGYYGDKGKGTGTTTPMTDGALTPADRPDSASERSAARDKGGARATGAAPVDTVAPEDQQ